MRAMGARRKTGLIPAGQTDPWEMPPKPGSRAHAAEKINSELSSIREQLHDQHREAGAPLYEPQQLIEARTGDVLRQIRSGQSTIVVKVPSGSEIQMSRETAQHLLKAQQQANLRRRR
jgi:hypothetical protein